MGDKAHENSRLRSLFTRRTWDIKGESFYTCERFEQPGILSIICFPNDKQNSEVKRHSAKIYMRLWLRST